ncbi:hypothetical protein CAter10_4061 [Collimonas arenae]|nr:hypothetical protein CAter10_4061 [Collimonas arenae]
MKAEATFRDESVRTMHLKQASLSARALFQAFNLFKYALG